MVWSPRLLGYNVWDHGWLQCWCRAEMPLSFISHLRGWVWSDDIEHEQGRIERETAVILAFTHSMRDLTVLSTRDVGCFLSTKPSILQSSYSGNDLYKRIDKYVETSIKSITINCWWSRDGSTKKHANKGRDDLSTIVIPTFFPHAPEILYWGRTKKSGSHLYLNHPYPCLHAFW